MTPRSLGELLGSLQRVDVSWREWAAARELAFEPGRGPPSTYRYPRITGRLRGHAFSLELIDLSWGFSWGGTTTRAVVALASPLRVKIRVKPEGLASRAAKLLGAGAPIFGDDGFDRAFSIGTSDEGLARRVLSPSVRSELLGFAVQEAIYDGLNDAPIAAIDVAEIVETAPELDALTAALFDLAEPPDREQGPYR